MAKSKRKLEYVGWGMWCICFLVLYGPSFYISWQVSYEDMRAGVLPWLLAFIISASVAGVLTTVTNTVLQRRMEAAQEAERQEAKKKKKSKKK